MTSIIPAVFFAFIVVALQLFAHNPDNEGFKTQVAAQNFFLWHTQSVDYVENRIAHGLSTPINVATSNAIGGFDNLGPWKARYYVRGGHGLIMTYRENAANYTNDEITKILAMAKPGIYQQLPAASAFGKFHMEGGKGYVGKLDVDAFSDLMTVGENYIVTYLD